MGNMPIGVVARPLQPLLTFAAKQHRTHVVPYSCAARPVTLLVAGTQIKSDNNTLGMALSEKEDTGGALTLVDEVDDSGVYKLRVEPQRRPRTPPAPGYTRVRLSAAALNRRDHWIRRGLYPGIAFPSVLGADGVGVVDAHGTAARASAGAGGPSGAPSAPPAVRSRVVIEPGVGWGDSERAPSSDYRVIGLAPLPGTFARWTDVPTESLFPAPEHLSDAEAAALPLAGLTAYRAVFTKGCVEAGHTVLVTGIGGGVALWAMQLALAAGARVYVTSSSEAKISKAVSLGAAGGALYTSDDWVGELLEAAQARFDAVIDGSGGDAVGEFIRLLNLGGIIVSYGATVGVPRKVSRALITVPCATGVSLRTLPLRKLPLTHMFLKNVELRGSTMGSRREFAALLEVVRRTKLKPVVDSVTPLGDWPRAFDKLRDGTQFGKVVLDVSQPQPQAKL